MLDGTYAITVETPLGRKSGTVTVTGEGDRVLLALDAPMIGKQRIVCQAVGTDGFVANGSMRIPLMGKVSYTARGQVVGDALTCDIESRKGALTVTGMRV